MSSIGFGIQHDRLYPDLQPQANDDFKQPLQLLAHELRFVDPVNGKKREFRSERQLLA